jgi:alpha-D-ribose 1-methylphosphonate 5-phosphate C-P lyase
MHAEGDYAAIWISLYEDIVRHGVITATTGYPALVGGRYVIATTPIPRWDVPKLDQAPYLSIFGAGREKRIYAIPPHTTVKPLTFEDVPFEVEVTDAFCVLCDADGRIDSFLVEVPGDPPRFVCSDAAWCAARSGRTSDEEL